ncbi:Oligopeptide transport ATP-binding protein OppF [compost metagenome]
MEDLQEQYSLTYMFISHDLSVVKFISDRVGVMYLGRLVEMAPTDDLFAEPLHPYTKALISALPLPDTEAKRERIILSGDVPNPQHPPSGCAFHTRCPSARPECKSVTPEWKEVSPGRGVACLLY